MSRVPKLSMEEKRDIYLTALLLEEANLYKTGSHDVESAGTKSDKSLCWDEWRMDFFGCAEDGWRKTLDNVYYSRVADTRRKRTAVERSIIWKFWHRVKEANLIGDGLHISKVINN